MSEQIVLDTSDPYAGVSGISSGSNEEHEQAMLEHNVPVRDGDDSIELSDDEDEIPLVEEETLHVEEGEEPETEEALPELNIDTSTVEEASDRLSEAENGFKEMKATAIERGVTPEDMATMEAYYEKNDTLTDEMYNLLAQVGYSKSFVGSYIRGQQALANSYVSTFVNSIGGPQAFGTVMQTLNASDPESAKALEKAIGNRDLSTAKVLINLAGRIRSQNYGVPAQRTVTSRATPAAPASNASDGFQTQQEMVKAMSDKRYNRDPAYTQEVLRKVEHAAF